MGVVTAPDRRSLAGWGLSLVSLLVLLGSCAPGGARNATPKEIRLGGDQGADIGAPGDTIYRPASGFFLNGAVLEETGPGEWRVLAWLDGHDENLDVQWTVSGASVEEQLRHPEHYALEARVRGTGPWSGSVLITRGGRPLDELDFSVSEPAPEVLAAASELRWSDAPGEYAVHDFDPAAAGQLRPMYTESRRWTREDGSGSAWVSASSGTLPEFVGGRPVPLDMAACADGRFPRQVGRSHVGCSPGPPDSTRNLDLLVGADSPGIQSIDLAASVTPQSRPEAARPDRSGVALDLSQGLVWTNPNDLGLLSGNEPQTHALPKGTFRGRPVTDKERFAFARPDRIEVGTIGSSARFQLPASPADGLDILALGGRWLASIEGSRNDERLVLRDLSNHRQVEIPTAGSPARPLLLGPWLLWEDRAGLHGLPLDGGQAWSLPLRLDRRAHPTLLDDWCLLRSQTPDSLGMVAVHVPTGRLELLGDPDNRAFLEARGAAAGLVTVW